MHGIIFKSMKDFVVENHGHDTWEEIRTESGLDGQIYLPIDTYDDAELFRLVETAADLTGRQVQELLEAFGRYVAGQLLETYGNVVDDEWDALDLVANTEEGIHTVLRAHNPDLDPPELECARTGDGQITVVYRSERRLCSVAKGIVLGVADHYGQDLTVTEQTCLLDGANRCEIVVRG